MKARLAVVALLALACVGKSSAAEVPEAFTAHCAACHGADGRARTPAGKKLGAKDLSESKFTDAEIETRILHGVKDKKGAERMPAFKERLRAEEVAALVAFVKTFRR